MRTTNLPPFARLLLLACVAVAATTASGPSVAATAPAAGGDSQTRTFELTYRAAVHDLPEKAGHLDLWIPYPQSDENQRVEVLGVEASAPYRVETEPRFGNQILHLRVSQPRQPVTVELRARIVRREVVKKDFGRAGDGGPRRDAAVSKWLAPDRLVPLDRRIRGLSREVTAGKRTDREKARAIYDYVVDTMSYDKSGTGWGNGDIYWACDKKRGNCTDFHALFTGLARAAGIPAKFAIGFPIPAERGAGKVAGYHCWSEFWLDGYGWVPVDTSEARKQPERRDYYFGGHDADRVELTEGRDLVLRPAQRGEPLNFFVYPYVEVDGKPHPRVEQSFSYRDVAAGEAGAGR